MTTRSTSRGAESGQRTVFRFALAHWARRKGQAALLCGAMSLATLTEIFVPVFAGRLIDALSLGPAGLTAALGSFGAIVALGLTMVTFRHLGWWTVVPFTLGIMRDVAAEAFYRVQRLSTDWHANSFAGSLVRKITRGMWAFDTLDDVVLLALLPALVVMLGTVVLLAAHWPVMGLVMALGSAAYVALAALLATRVLAPAARLSNQWDTRVGGMLADAIGTNGVVKAFAAEAREDARLAVVLDKWRRRTRRTWRRFTWSGSGQLALLWLVRSIVTGTALWLWSEGRASAGDVVYVLTAYLVLHGYLREVGHTIHQLQRAVNEMEELALLHEEPLGVEDRPGAAPGRSSTPSGSSWSSASSSISFTARCSWWIVWPTSRR
jgi:ATP-binding cassette subfamily B protein